MASFADMTIKQFLNEAASGAPVPGGGGIAALAGALGAAMASMAVNFTVGKPKYAEHDKLMRRFLAELDAAIDGLSGAVDGDAEAFSGISRAYAMPRDGDEAKEKRKAAIRDALTASMRVPLAVAEKCLEAARLLPRLAETANVNLLSDVEVAAIMLEAAIRAARVNVQINSEQLDGGEARQAEKQAEDAAAEANALTAGTIANIAARKAPK